MLLDWHVYIIIAVIWALSLILVRRKRDGDSAFMRLFQSNKDLDTTLDKVLKIFTVAGVFGLWSLRSMTTSPIGDALFQHDDQFSDAGYVPE